MSDHKHTWIIGDFACADCGATSFDAPPEFQALRSRLTAAEQRATSAEQALAARHGGEPLALLSELDEARETLAAAEQARDAAIRDTEHMRSLLEAEEAEEHRLIREHDAALQRAEEAETLGRKLNAALEDAHGVGNRLERRAEAAEAKLRRVEAALAEVVAAHDAERAAAVAAAKVRCNAYAGMPRMPKRIPRSAVAVSSLSPDEQRVGAEECARFMAPIEAAKSAHRTARDRVSASLAAARALSTPDKKEPTP